MKNTGIFAIFLLNTGILWVIFLENIGLISVLFN